MSASRWDIVDAVSPEEDVTERQTNPRGHSRSFGTSPFSSAVIMVSVAFSMSAEVCVPLAQSTSEVISVVHRAAKPSGGHVVRRIEKPSRPGIDFDKARSGEALAQAFDAYFRPPKETEEEVVPDESCFF
jgi:hypothetical protein